MVFGTTKDGGYRRRRLFINNGDIDLPEIGPTFSLLTVIRVFIRSTR